MGQETIHQEGMVAANPTRPESTYDRLVYNDAFFANTRALWDEHPNVLAQLLGIKNRPMNEIITLEEDMGISTMTNRSGETALVKRRRVDGCGEEVDDSLVRTEQPGGGTATNSSATGEKRPQAEVGGNSTGDADDTSPQEEDPDEIDNAAFLEAVEQEEANEQEKKKTTWEEKTTDKSAVDESAPK
jgi:hypothetical protein